MSPVQTTREFILGGRLLVLIMCVALGMAGCGGSQRELYHVSGTVTLDGEPVPAGFVSLVPDISAGNDGTQGYAEISSGEFDTSITGKGVTGGAYVLHVRGFVPPEGSTPGRMLFREYEQLLQLPAADSRQDIAVPASARAESELLMEPT